MCVCVCLHACLDLLSLLYRQHSGPKVTQAKYRLLPELYVQVASLKFFFPSVVYFSEYKYYDLTYFNIKVLTFGGYCLEITGNELVGLLNDKKCFMEKE